MAKGKNGAPKKRKRHTPFTSERKELYLEALRRGHTYMGACGAAGVSRNCADSHRESDPEFGRAVEIAFDEGVRHLESVALTRATNPEGASDTLLIFALKNKGWTDRQQVDLNAKGDFNIHLSPALASRVNADGDE